MNSFIPPFDRSAFDFIRTDKMLRRQIITIYVLRALHAGPQHLESVIAELKALLGFDQARTKDKGIIQQNLKYLRAIVSGIDLVDEHEFQQFIQGKVPPSTLGAMIRRRRTGSKL